MTAAETPLGNEGLMAGWFRSVLSRGLNISFHRQAFRWLSLSAIMLSLPAAQLSAAQVRVPEGTLVPLALHFDVTTENVVKGDRVDFDVVENVVVDNHVVIPKGGTGWATVVRVKGAGKKNAKDASVTFHIIGVHAIDNQPIALRLMPNKSRKQEAGENDIEESDVIAGGAQRSIGAAKGKRYAAYTDSEALVNAPENLPPVAAQSASSQTASKVATSPAPTAAQPVAPLPPPPVAVEFRSDPTGGEVVIDGSSVGITPTTLTLGPGLHDIEVHVAGYQKWKRKMRITPGSLPTVLAHMVKE
jgi:PEGA domain